VASFFPFAPPDVSGDVLSSAASFALRSYLAECGSVTVAVDADAGTLLAGTVSRVDITGTNWRSRKALTCRSLRMSVGEAVLDPGALLAERLIKLRRPSKGDAEIVFTEKDFGNFLTHPLVTEAAARLETASGTGGFFRFQNEATLRDGDAVFFAEWSHGSKIESVRYTMSPDTRDPDTRDAPGRVKVTAARVSTHAPDSVWEDAVCSAIAENMAFFFQTLVVDLSGARLSYRNMRVGDGTITLELDLEVVGFPPPSSLGMI
jgi:hypothetical protein